MNTIFSDYVLQLELQYFMHYKYASTAQFVRWFAKLDIESCIKYNVNPASLF